MAKLGKTRLPLTRVRGAVDGKKVDDDTASAMISGPEGSSIQMTVQKAGTRTTSNVELTRVASGKLLKLHLLSEALGQIADLEPHNAAGVQDGVERALALLADLQQITSKTEQELRTRMSSDQVILLTQVASITECLHPLRQLAAGVGSKPGSVDDQRLIQELSSAQLKLHTEIDLRMRTEQEKKELEVKAAQAEGGRRMLEASLVRREEEGRRISEEGRWLRSEVERLKKEAEERGNVIQSSQAVEEVKLQSSKAVDELKLEMKELVMRGEEEKRVLELKMAQAEEMRSAMESSVARHEEEARLSKLEIERLKGEVEALGKSQTQVMSPGAPGDKARLEANLKEANRINRDLKDKMNEMVSEHQKQSMSLSGEIQRSSERVVKLEKEQEAYIATMRRTQMDLQAAEERAERAEQGRAVQNNTTASTVTAELNELQRQVSTLRREKEVAERALHKSEQDAIKWQRQKDDLERDLRQSETELSKELIELRRERDDLLKSVEGSDSRRNNVRKIVQTSDALRRELSEANEKINQLRQEVLSHVGRNDLLNKEKTELSRRVENLVGEGFEKENIEVKAKGLEDQNKTMVEAFEKEKRTLLAQIKELKQASAESTGAEARLKNIEAERERLVDELNALRQSGVTNSAEAAKVKVLQAENDRLFKKLEDLGKQSASRVQQALDRAIKAEAEMREMETELKSMMAQFQDKCDAVSSLKDEMARMSLSDGIRKSLSSKVDNLTRELETKEKKIDDLRQQLREARLAKSQSDEEANNLRASTSGRLSIENELETAVQELSDMAEALNSAQLEIRRMTTLCASQQDRISQLNNDCENLRLASMNSRPVFDTTEPSHANLQEISSAQRSLAPSVPPRTPLTTEDSPPKQNFTEFTRVYSRDKEDLKSSVKWASPPMGQSVVGQSEALVRSNVLASQEAVRDALFDANIVTSTIQPKNQQFGVVERTSPGDSAQQQQQQQQQERGRQMPRGRVSAVSSPWAVAARNRYVMPFSQPFPCFTSPLSGSQIIVGKSRRMVVKQWGGIHGANAFLFDTTWQPFLKPKTIAILFN